MNRYFIDNFNQQIQYILIMVLVGGTTVTEAVFPFYILVVGCFLGYTNSVTFMIIKFPAQL